MSRYIPNTDAQQQEMLKAIGCSSMEELFSDIAEEVRLKKDLNLPEPMAEMELVRHMENLASKNSHGGQYVCFLGAGAYDHYIPAVVDHIISRSEFYTAYTPYQPEISQGTLQAIYEYQTMICELTGMEVANASMYDGATALAEAALMACQATRRNRILIAQSVNPEYREVLSTYVRYQEKEIVELDIDSSGAVDLNSLEEAVNEDTAAIIVQSPNFFGIIENLKAVGELAHDKKALFIVCTDPISLGLLQPPGKLGADIVVGEGQALGNPMSFGGPYLGFFAVTAKLMRRMPGRVVGETVDKEGKRGFVLTLQTREQHIRREKATSNICTNQALNALAATVYLSLLGKKGIREVALQCLHKAHYLYDKLLETGYFTPVFSGPFFKEFAVKSTVPIELLNNRLLERGIIGGYDLGKAYPDIKNGWLLAVTEKRTREEMDKLVKEAGDLANEN